MKLPPKASKDNVSAFLNGIQRLLSSYSGVTPEDTRRIQQALTSLHAGLATTVLQQSQLLAADHNKQLSSIHTFVAPLLSGQQKCWEAFSKAVANSLQRTNDALQRVELLAKLGWTLPTGMSVPEVNDLLLKEGLSSDLVDKWFVEYCQWNDGAEATGLTDALISADYLRFWQPLLTQAVAAFRRSEYAICVPSLLVVLEGAIALPWDVKFQSDKERKRFFDARISSHHHSSIDSYVWRSVAAFVQNLFESAVSHRRKYRVPKRHLILHGKSDPSTWDEADCLRLFQALSTVLFVSDEVERC